MPMLPNTGVLRELTRIKQQEAPLSSWYAAMPHVLNSGVVEVLRELGKVCLMPPETPNFVEAQALEAGRAYGVSQALDVLLNFRELLQDTPTQRTLPADFGGLDAAVNSQDLTKEEADAIRNNQPIPELKRVGIPNADRGERRDYSDKAIS